MKEIEKIIKEHNIVFALNCTRNASLWKTYGDDEKLKYKSILAEYFSTPKKLADTFDWIKHSELLPQIVTQSPVKCFFTKVKSGEIWALFIQHEMDIIEAYNKSLEIHNQLKEIENS